MLAHEIGHVAGRHSAERIAKSQFAQTLVNAVGVAASDDGGPNRSAQAVAGLVSQMVQLRYGRDDEIQSDTLGVRFMADAGYDPRAMIRVMEVLERASGGSEQPEFMSSHPDPGNRAERIRETIERHFPGGVPSNLTLGRPLDGDGAGGAPRGP